MVITSIFWRNILTIFFLEIEVTAVVEPSDTLLKLPQSVISESSCKVVAVIFCMDFSHYSVI
jgi:hypothetical protein